MTSFEARELRAVIAELLDPLYAGRVGTLPHREANERAIGVAHFLDSVCLTAQHLAQQREREGIERWA